MLSIVLHRDAEANWSGFGKQEKAMAMFRKLMNIRGSVANLISALGPQPWFQIFAEQREPCRSLRVCYSSERFSNRKEYISLNAIIESQECLILRGRHHWRKMP